MITHESPAPVSAPAPASASWWRLPSRRAILYYSGAAIVLIIAAAFTPTILSDVQELRQDESETAQLDAWTANLDEIYASKRQAAAEVAEGTLSLTEAAVRFRDLNRSVPSLASAVVVNGGGRLPSEVHCRTVIAYVRGEGHDDVAGRLEKELQEQVKAGSLKLPS